jgi:hypothetical protein
MKIADIIELENRRTEADKYALFLINDTKFWRAYGWSAWLCVKYVKQFEILKREIKSANATVCFVGFPVDNLERHFDGKADCVALTEKDLRMELRPDVVPQDITYEQMQAEYQAWFDALPLSKKKNEGKDASDDLPFTPTAAHLSVMGVMKEIMLFPTDEHSPTECVEFIRDLKKKITKILF